MSDIEFNCPHCEQHLAVDDEAAGMIVECPTCQEQIQIPEIERPAPQPSPDTTPRAAPPLPPPQAQQKECPFCGELILTKAVKCKHCGSMLDGSDLKSAGPSKPTEQQMLSQTAFMLLPGEQVMMDGLVSYVKGALNCADSNCYITNYRLVLSAKGLLGPAMFGAIGIAASRMSKSTKITFQIPYGQIASVRKGHHALHETLTFKTKQGTEYCLKFAFKKEQWYTAIRMASNLSW